MTVDEQKEGQQGRFFWVLYRIRVIDFFKGFEINVIELERVKCGYYLVLLTPII